MINATIKIGSRTLSVSSDVVRLAGFEVYSDGSIREMAGCNAFKRLARAIDELPEETSDERIVLRSIANHERLLEAERMLAEQQKVAEVEATAAKNERAAAGMKLWVHKQKNQA